MKNYVAADKEVKSPVSGRMIYRKLTTFLFLGLCRSRTICLSFVFSYVEIEKNGENAGKKLGSAPLA